MNGFNLWVGLGASMGLWNIWRSAPPRQARAWLNAGLLVLAAALAGARLFYTLQNWRYYAARPVEILQLQRGGLAWPGAAAGATLAVLGLAASYSLLRSRRTIPSPLGLVADRMFPLLPPVCVTIWLGCWQAGTAYGAAAPPGAWWGLPMLDETGAVLPRFPLQPLAALTLLLLFGALHWRVPALRPPGRLSGLAAPVLMFHTLLTTLVNATPAPTWRGLRVDTWFAAGYLTALILLFLFYRLRARVQHRMRLPSP